MDHPASLDDRSLLLTLEECSKLVAHSHDPHETLTNIVRLIRDRFQTAVCSVYLLEPEKREKVLAAAHEGQGGAVSEAERISALQGVSLSPGNGVGQAYVVDGFDEWRRTVPLRSGDLANEKRRLAEAMTEAREEIDRLSHRI